MIGINPYFRVRKYAEESLSLESKTSALQDYLRAYYPNRIAYVKAVSLKELLSAGRVFLKNRKKMKVNAMLPKKLDTLVVESDVSHCD